jgi:phospholipase/carboxylesterase
VTPPPAPVVITSGSTDPQAPLVVLLHGRGSDESGIAGPAAYLPDRFAYAAVRGPIDLGGAYTWFQNRGIGRPLPDSLRATLDWFRALLATIAPAGRPVVLVGFSGGAAFAGGLLLDDPQRWAGTAVLYGTLPFDAGLDVAPGRLDGSPVLVVHGDTDDMIPRDLLDRTWSYLHDASGAQLTAYRDGGGHAISTGGLEALQQWIGALLP